MCIFDMYSDVYIRYLFSCVYSICFLMCVFDIYSTHTASSCVAFLRYCPHVPRTEQLWSNCGATVEQLWSNCGATVEQLWNQITTTTHFGGPTPPWDRWMGTKCDRNYGSLVIIWITSLPSMLLCCMCILHIDISGVSHAGDVAGAWARRCCWALLRHTPSDMCARHWVVPHTLRQHTDMCARHWVVPHTLRLVC